MLSPISAIAYAQTYANWMVEKRSRTKSGASSATARTTVAVPHARLLSPRNVPRTSDPRHVDAAEQSAGSQQQHRHDDHQAEREPQVARAGHVGADQRQQHADDEPSRHRAGGVADPPQDGPRER